MKLKFKTTTKTIVSAGKQSGSVLLEALIAILIFSLGILAIVGMQASAVKASTDAKFRSDASMLANQLIGQMWVSNRTLATLQTFTGGAGSDGAGYTTWLADVQAALPGTASAPPVVALNPANNQVTIQVFWISPGEVSAHQYVVVAQVI